MYLFLSLTKSCCGAGADKDNRKSDDNDGQSPREDVERRCESTPVPMAKSQIAPGVITAESAGSAGHVTSKYERVTDKLVKVYVHNNPDVPKLDFDDCISITDKALWAISSSRVADCSIEKLSIRNCKEITDSGLLALADSKIKIGKIDTYGVQKMTLVAVTRLLFDCGATLLDNLPTELAQKVTAILHGKDPQSAVGKACLFLEAQPTAGTFTVPYTEGTTAAEQVSQMLFLALKTLANLTVGGLELHRTYDSISIDLTLLGVVEEVGHARDWPINENHFGILFSIPTLGSVLTSLNLSNANLKAGVDHLVKALPGCLVLKELNISYNDLGADSIKPILEALPKVQCSERLYLPLAFVFLSPNRRTRGR